VPSKLFAYLGVLFQNIYEILGGDFGQKPIMVKAIFFSIKMFYSEKQFNMAIKRIKKTQI